MESQNVVSVPLIEIEVSKLPSRGASYPEGSTIKYRTYTHGEIRKFSIQNASTSQSIEMALDGLEITGFDKMRLTILDALYIGLLRKVSSMGGLQMQVPYVCGECGKASEKIFTSNDIEFEDLSQEVTALPLVATLNGVEVHFNILTVKSYLDLERGKYAHKTQNGKANGTVIEALMIENLPFDKAYDLLYNLNSPEDIETLEEIDQLLKHDIKPLVARCTQQNDDKVICNHTNLIKLEGREALIRPFRGGEGSARTRIRFGHK